MKKLAIRAAAILLLLGVAATGAYAAGGAGYTDENSDGVCDYYAAGRDANFTDENGDGVCDHYTAGRGANFTDEDGDGVCDHYAAGRGANFTDENGDGVCDRYAGGCRRQAGRRAGRGGNF